jgi:hypothetical protein
MSVVDSLVKAGVPDGTIIQIFEEYPIGEKYREKGASKERWLSSHIEKAKGFTKPDETSIVFPSHIMSGAAGQFANVYGSVLETPQEFLFMAFLTVLGTLLATKVTLATELKPQPRLYTLLLGQSANARKSTAIDTVVEFFQGYSKKLEISRGVGSAEGLQKEMEGAEGGLLLVQDEFSQLITKGKIDASVLVPMINTLFESNSYENQTKNSGIRLDKAYLSILAASTTDTYERIWTPSLIAIGFPNRIFIVPGAAQRKIAIPRKVSGDEKRELMAMVDDVVQHVDRHRELNLTPEAKGLYSTWYSEKENSIHALRLDTISLRLMILLTINELKPEVDEEIVRKVIEIANWQLKTRKLHDPIDAENNIARMEEKIRRQLAAGPKTDRVLRQKTNADRAGLWFYETAKNNLKRAGEIVSDGKTEKWSLVR